jgi:hypothetical protein
VGPCAGRVSRRADDHGLRGVLLAFGLLLLVSGASPAVRPGALSGPVMHEFIGATTNDSPVGNFSASIDRLVELLGVAGSGLLALAWARVALSWFSHDVSKKVQAKDRARDALIGTLLFVAALTGLIWGLAHWVLTGS